MALEKCIDKKSDIIAKRSENHVSSKLGISKFLNSYRVLVASLDKLSATLTSFPPLDANGMENDLFEGKPAYPYEKGRTIEYFTNHWK